MVCTKLLSMNKWNLERDILINIFRELNEKYIEDPKERFEWVDNMED